MSDSNQQAIPHDKPNDSEEEEESFIKEGEAIEVEVNDEDDTPMDLDGEEEEEDTLYDTFADTLRTYEETRDMSIQTIDSHNRSPIYAVASHYDDEDRCLSIVTGGGDDKAYLHKLDDEGNLQTMHLCHVHTDSVCCVATNEKFVTDAINTQKFLAVGGYDGTIALYKPRSGEKVQLLDGPTDVEFLSFHPKGGSVLLAGSISDGTVWMYHLPTSKCLQVFVGHECNGESGGVTRGSFTPDGKFALTVGMDGTMRLWAPRTGMCKHVFRLTEEESGDGDVSGLICLALGGGVDGQLAIAGGGNGRAYVVHLQAKKVVAVLRHFDPLQVTNNIRKAGSDDNYDDDEEVIMVGVEAVGFAPKGLNPNWVATGGSDGILKIWDLAMDAQCRQSCTAKDGNGATIHTGGVTKLCWHPTLPVIFASYTDGAVRLWHAKNGNLVHTLTCGKHDNQINDFSIEILVGKEYQPANTIVISAHDDGTAKIFRFDITDILSKMHQEL